VLSDAEAADALGLLHWGYTVVAVARLLGAADSEVQDVWLRRESEMASLAQEMQRNVSIDTEVKLLDGRTGVVAMIWTTGISVTIVPGEDLIRLRWDQFEIMKEHEWESRHPTTP
jgi:hypothetical protein